MVSNYEEKQREVLQENRDLRAALESLQVEHRAVTNQQVCPRQLRRLMSRLRKQHCLLA